MRAPPPQPNDERVTLRPVDADDWRAVAGLAVTDAQRAFVATPAYYLALCAYGGGWRPMSVRLGDQVIGFVMWAVDPDDGSCWLGGLLVDRRHQRRGHGRRAVQALMDHLATVHGHRDFALSYDPANPAKRLYEELGFRATGETEGDEVVARRSLP